MDEFLTSVARISVLVFAVTSMASVGLAHSFKEVLYPLRNVRAVVRVLVANFVLVPILGIVVTQMLALPRPLEVGLILISMAAGAPFVVKLAAQADHNVALSTTLLVLLLPATAVFMPLIVPLVLKTWVSARAIAVPLFLTMLLPLAIGMMIHERFSSWSERAHPIPGKVSSVMLIVLVATTLLANLERARSILGSGGILAAILLISGAFVIGYALGGQKIENRGVVALATAQRNIAAATVVATQSFEDSGVLVMVIVTSLVGLAILFPAARALRQRAARWVQRIMGGTANEMISAGCSQLKRMEINMNDKEAHPSPARPNILIICIDQWDRHMRLPREVQLPALKRIEARGVSFGRHYCTVPVCTPSRASMWTGVHAKKTGLWDNTNFAWIHELSSEFPTVGQMLREQGYYTAFKGKWHCSDVPRSEDALERFGFSDYQQWGEMFGAPLQGAQLDPAATFEAVDWLEHKGKELEQPWLLICSLVNPHDVMFLQTDPVETPHPKGAMTGLQTTVQSLAWFQQKWNVALPENFEDDLALQPYGVRHYKEQIELHYGQIPDHRTELWLERRNYMINAMRLVDAQVLQVLNALDRLDLWRDTVVIFTGDHGEMNGAHQMAQKGAIPFDEAAVVNLTICAPGGQQAKRTAAVGSHLDLAPTLLHFAGLSEEEIQAHYPHLKGRSLKEIVFDAIQPGPRGSVNAPGDGALYCWDGLHSLDKDWAITGALRELTEMGTWGRHSSEVGREERLHEAGRKFGAPDFSRRTFFRAVVDGRYKLVRWFSPEEYGNPNTVEDLYASSDVALYDLINDPGELQNLAHPDHPVHDLARVAEMLGKLSKLVREELGVDEPPFDLDLFGTRDVKYHSERVGAFR